MKKPMIISLCLVTLLVTGCGKVAKLKNGEEVVAQVDGVKITAEELYDQTKALYMRNVLIDIIDRTILDKVYETDNTMKSTVQGQIDTYKQQLGDQFLTAVKSQTGLNSEQEFYDSLILNYKRNEAIKDYAKKSVTDTEINNYYEKETVGDIKASHIIIKPEVTDSMTADEKTTKEKEAEDKIKQIITKLDNGEKFEDLAKQYGQDGTAQKGGDLDWFNKGEMDSAFEAAAYALKVGEYTKTPVKSSFGYHVILKTDGKEKPSLEQAKEGIIETISKTKLDEANSTLPYEALNELRKEHKLDIQDSELKKQYNDYMDNLLKQ